jgi:hypothetical protein
VALAVGDGDVAAGDGDGAAGDGDARPELTAGVTHVASEPGGVELAVGTTSVAVRAALPS